MHDLPGSTRSLTTERSRSGRRAEDSGRRMDLDGLSTASELLWAEILQSVWGHIEKGNPGLFGDQEQVP